MGTDPTLIVAGTLGALCFFVYIVRRFIYSREGSDDDGYEYEGGQKTRIRHEVR